MAPKARARKKIKIDKPNYVKIKKNFCASKNTMSRLKRQFMRCKNIFINHVSDKGLISKVYKDL